MDHAGEEKPLGAGKSSFSLIDAAKVFEALPLKEGTSFLDVASGRGEYTMAASRIVGTEGRLYAVDLWQEGIETLRREASAKGIKNLEAMVADVGEAMPLEDESVDVCLIATALHDFVEAGVADGALREISRVLRAQGTLAVVEFKKIEGPPGPPLRVRLSPEEVEAILGPYGFRKVNGIEVGPYNYLLVLRFL